MADNRDNILTTSYGRPLSEKEIEKLEQKEARERKKLVKPMRTAVHPTRIIAYLVQLAIAIVVYDFLRNHFMLIVLVIIGMAPVLDLFSLFFLYRGLEIDIQAPEREVYRNGVGFIKLVMKNPTIVVSYDVGVNLKVENAFYQDVSGTLLSLPVSARSNDEKHIPVRYSMNGIYKYSIETFTVRDLLGFVSLKKNVDTSAEVHVYPDTGRSVELDMNDMSRGMTESEETVKKGHDFSDVSDVREYIPGDKLMSIHWKLSAKRDILMVKDRISMSDQQMIILVDLGGSDDEVDEIISLTYGIVAGFVRNQIYVKLMWWSEGGFAFRERQIMNLTNLKEAYSDMYYEKTYSDGDKIEGYMRSIHPEYKAYVKVCMNSDRADAVIVEQD